MHTSTLPGVSGEAERLLDEIEQRLVALRRHIRGFDSSARRHQADEHLYDRVDYARRRRPNWLRRGLVFAAILDRGGEVADVAYDEIVRSAGYDDVRAVNRFFEGAPEPVLERHGERIRLTERGRSAAVFFLNYWLPKLRAGTVAWPTNEERHLVHATEQDA